MRAQAPITHLVPMLLRLARPAPLVVLALSALCPGHAGSATVTLEAGNAGPLTGTGRELVFAGLPAVSGEIVAASLELDLNYSAARDLRFTLVDGSGVVELPLGSLSSLSALVTMNGRYRLSDRAVRTWLEDAPPVAGNLSPLVVTRPFQFGQGGVCFNLLARYLEFDIDRTQPLTLRVGRLGGGSGSGALGAARLTLETDQRDTLFASGVEEGPTVPVPCKRPSFDLVLNGGNESFARSPLTLLRTTGGTFEWTVEQLDPPQTHPALAFGSGNDVMPYPGRFGGRTRLNIGFWDALSGTLNFTTGAGARHLALEGDWVNTAHQVIPGDYDGDGTTDLAIAFRAANGRWLGRIRFSSTDRTRDFFIDPRDFSAAFTSADIGFGQGQDADRNGADEITLFFREREDSPAMRLGQIVPNLDSSGGNLFTNLWGAIGDRLVLGKWVEASSGNQFGLMVVRPAPGGWTWFRFPDQQAQAVFGLSSDEPLSINIDLDALNDIAVWRASDRTLRAIRSTDGQQVVLGPFTESGANALAFLLGTTAPLAF